MARLSPSLIEIERGPVRQPYPLSWEEHARLYWKLAGHLQRMALYKVNAGIEILEAPADASA